MYDPYSNAEKIKTILNPIALKLKYVLDIIVDYLIYIFEYLRLLLNESYLNQYKITKKQSILYKLYGIIFAFVKLSSLYILLPFHILPKLYMACIFSVINTLIDMKIILQTKIKNKKIYLQLFIEEFHL
ncbi:permeases of the major facilitator superfamily (apicoplast) [Babesia ovis]|uniref:Permeases of the major facilitator superfamily n=1 Tax=Babesia ovis TaxID=5869 RepID=A0A9W5TD04_BABOV|nr:permeases of the major facilitator superfamily [Babesia ovis]